MKELIIVVSFVFVIFGISACNSSKRTEPAAGATASPTPSAKAVRTSPPAQSTATISANPNPVPAGNGMGKTTIKWTTGDRSVGQVYVSTDNGDETLFGEGVGGSSDANWIVSNSSYEFRLYSGSDRAKLLAKVQVTRAK
jgi:hypothetical protein